MVVAPYLSNTEFWEKLPLLKLVFVADFMSEIDKFDVCQLAFCVLARFATRNYLIRGVPRGIAFAIHAIVC